MARINTDGSLDATFQTNIGTGPDDNIDLMVLQPDGKILLASEQDMFFDGAPTGGLVRLNSDGTVDGTFNLGSGFNDTALGDEEIYTIALQSDGKLLVGGYFDEFDGTPVSNIVRLNPNGSLENSFGGNGGDDIVWDIEVQPDDKVWVAGMFDVFNGVDVNDGLIRLNSDLTNEIQPIIDEDIYVIKLQDDGKLLVQGDFFDVDGNPVEEFARLNSDGTYDASFQPFNLDEDFYEITLQADGKILIAADVGAAVRLNADGSLDPTHVFLADACTFFDVAVGDDAAYWVGDFLGVGSSVLQS